MARAGLSSCNALHSINFRGFQHETFSFYRLLSASIGFYQLPAAFSHEDHDREKGNTSR
jgi:hypothetical protein